MSFTRKSHKLLVQVCRDCLVKRPLTTRFQSTLPTPASDMFRKDLYHKTDLLQRYSPPVRKTIQRREERKKLVANYKQLKLHHPEMLAQLTQTEVDDLIKGTEGADAFDILQDLKKGKIFRVATFRQVDGENMIYLAIRMKWIKKATQLLEEFSIHYPQLDLSVYESVIEALATKGNGIDKWIDLVMKREKIPSKAIVRSFVLSRVHDGKLEEAAEYIRKYHPTSDLTQLVTRHGDDDYELLDHALNIFAMDYFHAWRLEDMRQVYLKKRQNGMSTSVIIKNLIGKSLHTGQVHTIAEKVLGDTLLLGDTVNTQLCAKKLIGWYISNKDMKHAVRVWETLKDKDIQLPQDVLYNLLINTAKLKYHVDTMRIYEQYTDLYPQVSGEVHVGVLKCLVRSNNFKNAEKVQQTVENILGDIKPNLARTAVRSLFSLAAQTGNVDMFERVFRKSEKLKLSLTHKGLTSLIACYLTRGDIRSAKAAFQSVASHTDGPDVVDFNLLMRTVVMEDKAVNYDKILDILQHMNMVNIKPDETTMRTMLGFYKSESDMQKSIYDKLLVNPDAISRFDQIFLNNIAIGSLLTRMNIIQVMDILKTNRRQALFPTESPYKRIHVNGMTYKMLLDAANKETRYTHIAECLLKDMQSRGMKPSKEVYLDLIRNLAKKGKIQKARKYILKMEKETGEKATIKTWTQIVDGLLSLEKPLLAKEIFLKDMKGLLLDDVAFKKLKKVESKIK